MDFETLLVHSRQEIALDLLVIELIKAEQVIKANNLVILREDVVCSPDMPDVRVAVLFTHTQNPNLHLELRRSESEHTI